MRQLLILLLLVTGLKGWFWSAIYPPFQASDEIHHIGYARDIERERKWIVTARDYFIGEEIIVNELASVSNVSGYRRPLNLEPQQVSIILQLKQKLNESSQHPPAEESRYVRFFSQHHPPLYYFGGTLVGFIVRPTNILSHLAWARGLSVLLALITVSLTYNLSRLIWPSHPARWVGMATLVSFAPMFTYLSSVYTNQALEITLFSAMLLLLAMALHAGLTLGRAVLLGIVLGLGLLTKSSFLASLFLVICVANCALFRYRQIKLWVVAFLIAAFLGALWYLPYISGANAIVSVRQAEVDQCAPLGHYVMSAPIWQIFASTWKESLLSFGHRDTFLPEWMYTIINLAFVLSMVGWFKHGVNKIIVRKSAKSRNEQETSYSVWVLFVVASIVLYVFYFIVAYTLSCEKLTEMQGRQMTVLLIPLLFLLLQGWWYLFPKKRKQILGLFVILVVALNFYSLNELVIKRYYGSQTILSAQTRNMLSNPLSENTTVTQCFKFQEGQTINRFDLWLHYKQTIPKGELDYVFYDQDGMVLLKGATSNLGWVADYPAYALFRPLKLPKESCVQLSGNFRQPVQVWVDSEFKGVWGDGDATKTGRLAIILYEPVSWQDMLSNFVIQSADFYTMVFYQILGLIYLAVLVLFLFFFFQFLGNWQKVFRKPV